MVSCFLNDNIITTMWDFKLGEQNKIGGIEKQWLNFMLLRGSKTLRSVKPAGRKVDMHWCLMSLNWNMGYLTCGLMQTLWSAVVEIIVFCKHITMAH